MYYFFNVKDLELITDGLIYKCKFLIRVFNHNK